MSHIRHHNKEWSIPEESSRCKWELKEKCCEEKLHFLDHGNTITVRHLNASKHHLNKRGTQVLSNVSAETISNFTNWQFILYGLGSDNRKNRSTNDHDENKAKFKFGAVSAGNLNAIRKRNINRLIIGQLKINSLRNKFESLVQQVTESIDILMVSETKLDNSFPVSQFLIDGYTPPFRLDRDNNGRSIMLFVREDIPC